MKHFDHVHRLLLILVLFLPPFAHATVTTTINFDQFAPGQVISNQIPGISFATGELGLVASPPTLANPTGPSVSAASLREIYFAQPVTEVSMKLSLDFMVVTNIESSFVVILVGQDEHGNQVAMGGGASVLAWTTNAANWAPVMCHHQISGSHVFGQFPDRDRRTPMAQRGTNSLL
jgi:hypothetical protein